MGRAKIVAGVIGALVVAGCSSQPSLRVGSKNFTEQVVLGEIIAQHLEKRLNMPVARSLNLGGTLLAHQSLVSGQIDLYPEYTGTALTAILKQPAATDAAAVRQTVRGAYGEKFQIELLDPLGIDNGFAMVIHGGKEQTLSEASRRFEPWRLGVGYEFEQRPDGLDALRKTYGLRVPAVKTMDLGLLYKALEDGQVDMIAANATDGLLSKPGFQVLADDRHAFPPYEICIEVRNQSLARWPGLREALAELSSKFSNDAMRKLNYRVDVEHAAVSTVAADFLKSAGL